LSELVFVVLLAGALATDVRQPSSVVVDYRTRGFACHRASRTRRDVRQKLFVFSRSAVRLQSRQTSDNRRQSTTGHGVSPGIEQGRTRRDVRQKLFVFSRSAVRLQSRQTSDNRRQSTTGHGVSPGIEQGRTRRDVRQKLFVFSRSAVRL